MAAVPGLVSDPGMAETDPRNHWPFLDLVRAGAALLVMLGHARGHFFPEYGALSAPGPLTKAFYLLTGLQHEGVVVFFLVSGFLVGGSAWASFADGRFEPLRYLANRFVRIYMVLIPGLALTLAIHAVGTAWFADTRSFAALPAQPWSWAMGLCHLAALQGISCSVLVANAPLWSLSYEWLLYLAAPLVLGLGLGVALDHLDLAAEQSAGGIQFLDTQTECLARAIDERAARTRHVGRIADPDRVLGLDGGGSDGKQSRQRKSIAFQFHPSPPLTSTH